MRHAKRDLFVHHQLIQARLITQIIYKGYLAHSPRTPLRTLGIVLWYM